MIDKLLGRDTIEESTEEPVEKPAEMPVSKPKKVSAGLTIEIRGLWSGKAGDYDPKPEITVPDNTDKLFYRIESSGSGFGKQRHITQVFLDGRMVVNENGTIKEGDPTDTGIIRLPSSIKEPGKSGKITISIKSWDGKVLYVSPEFLVNIQ